MQVTKHVARRAHPYYKSCWLMQACVSSMLFIMGFAFFIQWQYTGGKCCHSILFYRIVHILCFLPACVWLFQHFIIIIIIGGSFVLWTTPFSILGTKLRPWLDMYWSFSRTGNRRLGLFWRHGSILKESGHTLQWILYWAQRLLLHLWCTYYVSNHISIILWMTFAHTGHPDTAYLV